MPIFTTELGKMKGDQDMEEDDDVEDLGSESVSSFEEEAKDA